MTLVKAKTRMRQKNRKRPWPCDSNVEFGPMISLIWQLNRADSKIIDVSFPKNFTQADTALPRSQNGHTWLRQTTKDNAAGQMMGQWHAAHASASASVACRVMIMCRSCACVRSAWGGVRDVLAWSREVHESTQRAPDMCAPVLMLRSASRNLNLHSAAIKLVHPWENLAYIVCACRSIPRQWRN
jgi:hypothetical protein